MLWTAMNKLLFPLLFLFSFTSYFSFAVPAEGDTLTSYLGKNRQGDAVSITEMHGKVIVVSFWATWCPYCIKELSALEKIQRQISKDKLDVVAVNFKESRKVFSNIKRKLKGFAITITHDKRGTIGKEFDVSGLPHMLIIDKNGTLKHIHKGYSEKSLPKLIEQINHLLVST